MTTKRHVGAVKEETTDRGQIDDERVKVRD